MNQLKWELLAELNNRFEADLLKSYLEAEGIQVQLFQEGVGQDIYPGNIGPMAMVQLFVPKEKFDAAQDILDTYKSSDVDSDPGEDNSE
jgi:hypothetical protein